METAPLPWEVATLAYQRAYPNRVPRRLPRHPGDGPRSPPPPPQGYYSQREPYGRDPYGQGFGGGYGPPPPHEARYRQGHNGGPGYGGPGYGGDAYDGRPQGYAYEDDPQGKAWARGRGVCAPCL